MRGGELGISGTVSALLTVLLLVAGFAVSTGLLSAIYSAQSEVLRKAVNVGEAVSERLQAFVYEDVGTNRTLLTIRNVGSTGSEVEYLMAVGYDGNVLREVRLNNTIRLGIQQVFTTYLSTLMGSGFDDYAEVRSKMATLYLKTVKGGVFGSGYMAPPAVMTAAYATSTTTVSTTETTTVQLYVETGATPITTWTAMVIIDNPMHWPVEAYVGVAFPRHFQLEMNGVYLHGYNGHYMSGFPTWGFEPGLKAKNRNDQLVNVTAGDIYLPRGVVCTLVMRYWSLVWEPNSPFVYRYSRLGPTYFVEGEEPPNVWEGRSGCIEGFEPRMPMPRLVVTTQTYRFHSPYTTITQIVTTDLRDRQYATFPNMIHSYAKWSPSYGVWYYVRHNYRLAYIKAVSLFNTTEVLAYVRGNETSTIHIQADRPIGLAAVYVYDSTDIYIPPPPSGGGECYEFEYVFTCKTGPNVVGDVYGASRKVPCGQLGTPMQVTVNCGPGCKAWVAPRGPGNYKTSEVQECPNGRCTVTPGSTIIYGYPKTIAKNENNQNQ